MLVIIAALIIVGLIGHQLEKNDNHNFMIKLQYACFGAATMGLLALYIGNPHVDVWQQALLEMMREIIIVTFLLWFGDSIACATDQYGEWSLDKARSDVISLSNKDMRPEDNRVLVAELGFICDHRYKNGEIDATLIPFDGTYTNQQRDVSVLVKKSADHITPSDLSQKQKNGFKYIFLNDQELLGRLVNYFKSNEVIGTKAVHFFFSGDFDGQIDILDHVVISLSGFSDGFAALSASCQSP